MLLLEFKFTPQIKQQLQSASDNFNAITEKLKFDVVQYDDLGKDYIKQQKLSPDSVMQLAFQVPVINYHITKLNSTFHFYSYIWVLFVSSFQMGYYKLYNKVGATYESCSTAAFKHGRTETIRSATTATQKCSQAFLENKASPQELRKLIEDCSKVHGNLTKEAALGNIIR